MLIPEAAIKFVSILYGLFALLGAFLVAYTAYTARKRKDDTLLRARAFINKSFMRDNGALLFLACLFFFVHTIMEFNNTFGLFIEESIAEFIKEISELGISICIVVLAYKWFKLMRPSKYIEQVTDKEHRSK
jgi:uncharacterized membrane protein